MQKPGDLDMVLHKVICALKQGSVTERSLLQALQQQNQKQRQKESFRFHITVRGAESSYSERSSNLSAVSKPGDILGPG